MKVAVIGSRDAQNLTAEKIIPYIPKNCSRIISGGAVGVDSLAAEAAKIIDVPIDVILPDYENFGKIATLKRNEIIANSCHLLLAFWDFKSRGTAYTLVYCIENHIPFKIIPINPQEILLEN